MTTQSIGMKALTSTALFAALVLPARADLLIDPISLLSSEYHYFGFAGLNPSYETDLDVSNQNATVESTVDRAASLNIGLFYNFSKTFGYYWSLTADSDSTYVSGATEIDVEGFTNSLGFYSMFGLSSDYPTAGWAEATMVRLEANSPCQLALNLLCYQMGK